MKEYVVIKKNFTIRVPAVTRYVLNLRPGTILQVEVDLNDKIIVLRPVAEIKNSKDVCEVRSGNPK